MQTVTLESFKGFEDWLEQLAESQTAHKGDSNKYYSPLLFRGHGDESWPLLSTLERYSNKITMLGDYLHLAEKIRFEVELHTDKKWDSLLKKDGFIRQDNTSDFQFYADIPSLEYLVHLRHHGFPSPLLDWTRSPYIAALFAYSGCNNHEGNIAIYVYQGYMGVAKSYSSHNSFIQGIGRYMNTHKRHTLQQAEYTICLQKNDSGYDLPYEIKPHEDHNSGYGQDMIYKITLPKSERFKILEKLEKFNLTLYSILGNEESLMSTLAMRELNFKND